MTSTAPPPRPDIPGTSAHGRGVAIVLMVVALTAQVLFVLGGLVLLSLGGATGLGFGVFLLVAAGAGWALLWLVAAILRGRVPPNRALLALVVPLADVLIVVFLSTGTAFGGSCSERELAIIDEIAPYPGAAAAFDYESSSGACAASLEVAASPQEVLGHYRGELEDDGWTVLTEDVPAESEGEPVTVKELSAHRGSDSFTIALESYSGHTSAAIRVDAD
jgi:hypothetical protein